MKTSDELDVQQEVNKLSLVALGTANGTILLYSVTKSELHSQLANGHSDRVNDIAWFPASDSLFSCSNDKYVIEWSISKSSIKRYLCTFILLFIFIHFFYITANKSWTAR